MYKFKNQKFDVLYVRVYNETGDGTIVSYKEKKRSYLLFFSPKL